MTDHSKISSFIWQIADDSLRGLFKPHEYGDIILPFTILRRLDCVLENKKDTVIDLYKKYYKKTDNIEPIILKKIKLKFYNYSNYDLSRLLSDPSNIYMNLQDYLGRFNDEVHAIIEGFQIEKLIEKLNKGDRLFSFIHKFSEVDLHPNKVSNRHMGIVFEELLRRFSEMSNETSGEHYTPRDIVELLVGLVFSENRDQLNKKDMISIFDPCCGTGGMLTVAKEHIRNEINEKLQVRLLGQELNPQTYSICKADMIILNEEPKNICLGSSLTEDKFENDKFDYMITNPPFGVSWKSEERIIKEEERNGNRFNAGTPRVSDGSLLFLQHMISKMEPTGSRIGIIFNGSPLFTGDAGSGESNIRKWIIENDLLEGVVALPDQLFFNTGISTYIWIVTNKKTKKRKGKVQLIDGTSFFKPMKKSLGNKRKEIINKENSSLVNLYLNFKENEYSKIYSNEFFGYTKVTVEQALLDDKGKTVKKKGEIQADTKKRDYERVPLDKDIEEYFNAEVKPHLQNAWMDREKDKIGYEINFTKYFYKYKPLRPLEEITKDLLQLDKETEGLMKEILED